MDNLTRVDPTSKIYEDARLMVQQLWEISSEEYNKYVPCPQPRSLMVKDMLHIKSNPKKYMVAPKTDGVRMFLLFSFCAIPNTELDKNIEVEYSVFMDRNGIFYQIPITSHTKEIYNGTLLDGELCNGKYVIFDVIAVNGYSTKKKSFYERCKHLRLLYQTLYCTPEMGLTLELKNWRPLHEIQDVYMSHKEQGNCDGMILCNVTSPLTTGTQQGMLKWKPQYEHTIDFHVLRDNRSHQLVLWLGTHREIPASNLQITQCKNFEDECSLLPSTNIHDFVMECSMKEISNRRWVATPVRLREDKVRGNSGRVASLTLKTIKQNITLDALL